MLSNQFNFLKGSFWLLQDIHQKDKFKEYKSLMALVFLKSVVSNNIWWLSSFSFFFFDWKNCIEISQRKWENTINNIEINSDTWRSFFLCLKAFGKLKISQRCFFSRMEKVGGVVKYERKLMKKIENQNGIEFCLLLLCQLESDFQHGTLERKIEKDRNIWTDRQIWEIKEYLLYS